MVNVKLAKTLASIGLAAACVGALAACGGNDGTSGVAATVKMAASQEVVSDGTSPAVEAKSAEGTVIEIPEADVTEQIESIRTQVVASYQQGDESMTADDAWGQYLVAIGMTPESLREQVIDSLISRALVDNGAAEQGVVVDEAEVDSYVKEMSSRYGSEEEWKEILAEAGFTEESYRDTIRTALIDQGLQEKFSETAKADDAATLELAQSYAQYYDGAKRSSHILFKVDDPTDEAAMEAARTEAQEVLGRINSGELDFAEAAKEYSDDSSAANGGDVGWNRMNNFVTEYADALDALELNEVSGLVQTEHGIHIIKCTEVFKAPETITSMDQIPEAFRQEIESSASSSAVSTAYQDWIDLMRSSAEIVINPMPARVPYNIDLTPYQTAADVSAAVEETSAAVEETSPAVTESSPAVEGTSPAVEGTSPAVEGTSAPVEGRPAA